MRLANQLANQLANHWVRARGYRALYCCRQFLSVLIGVMALGAAIAPAADAADLAQIKKRGYMIVGVKDNLRPLGFRNEAGQLEGLEIDLARRIAQEILGNAEAITLQPLANSDRIPALLEDKVDLVIARVTATPSRSRLVDFSTPYYLDGTTFVTRSAQTLKDLQQQSIAVLNGSDMIAVVRSRLPQARLVGVDSYEEAQKLLETNQVSAFAADATVLTGWVQEFPQYHLLPQLISTAALAVAMPRGLQYEDLRQRVNGAIGSWQAQGLLRQSILNWGLPEEGIPSLRLSPNQETGRL
jgi:polar amino acid transport system substrate-binding protein